MRVVVLWMAIGLLSGALSAQRFGQWWWDGSLGLAQRGTDNTRNGRQVNNFDQQELRLSLGVNGYLGHPALGQFRLGLDLALTEVESGRSVDTERTGLAAEVSFLPRGSYPFSLFYRQQRYDYTTPDDERTLPLLGVPDTSTEWGGKFRIRKGPLRGTLMGVNHAGYDLVSTTAREDVQDNQFVDWSRSGERLQHHVRLEHRLREYGTVDLEIEDLTLNLEQRGDLTESWGWQMSGVGIHQETGVGGDARRTSDDFRLRTRLYRSIGEDDQLDFDGNFGLSRSRGGDSVESAGLAVFYRWRLRQRWELAPFVRYGRQTAGEVEIQAPRAGLSLSWQGTRGEFNWLAGGSVSYGSLKRRDPKVDSNESQSAFSVNASIGHGKAQRLRKELEVEAGRNQLRFSRTGLPTDLADLGLVVRALGDEDFYRARSTLSHRWDSKSLSGWAEWSRREATNNAVVTGFSSDTLTSTLQFGSRQFTLQANVGKTRVDQPVTGDQEIRFRSFGARWKPWRHLSFNGSYRGDVRDLVQAPDIDGDRIEITLELRLGQIVVVASAFETNEYFAGGDGRSNRGVRWAISRRLAGWLPIVTGTQRRGVIR